jgi:hypothetical protein
MHGAIMAAYRTLTSARGRHPAMSRNLRAPLWYRVVSSVWASSLEQEFVNRSPKQELARAWLMYNTLWPRLVAGGKVTVPAPSQTAFAAIDYGLLLVFVLWHHKGYVADLRAALQNTTLGQAAISTLLDCYTERAEALVEADAPTLYPRRGFANPFARFPILRIGDATLVCPDPSVLFAGVEFRILQQALAGDFDRTSKAFGFVFEAYGVELLSAAPAQVLGGQLVAEFNYQRKGQQVASPDALVTGHHNVVFEFKALRYPYKTDESSNVRAFVSWLSKLTGANDERGPLEQGASFFDDVESNIVPGFPRGSLNSALYVVVSYQDIPTGICNSLAMRARFWKALNPWAQSLSQRTAFVSIRDLETVVTLADAAHRRGLPFGIANEFHAWWADASRRRLPPSFRDYLLTRYAALAGHSLPLHSQALDSFSKRVDTAAFGELP